MWSHRSPPALAPSPLLTKHHPGGRLKAPVASWGRLPQPSRSSLAACSPRTPFP